MKKINQIYEQVVVGNRYDLAQAEKHTLSLIQSGIKANCMPNAESQFVKENHVGCCLHYSMYLIALLHEAGIRCYFTTTPESDGASHCSVLYFDEKGGKHIADPVSDVQNGTRGEHMCIDYDEFVSKAINNDIKHFDLYGKFGEEEFFNGFFPNRVLDLDTILDDQKYST